MIGELSLLAAIGIGALHSMEPGHGKSILSAYIVSTQAKVWQAMLLGVIAAFSHALSIFFLAFLTSVSIRSLTPDQFIHWIEMITSLFIIFIGFSRMRNMLKPHIITVKKWNGRFFDHEDHEEDHHHHHHFHAHVETNKPLSFSQFLSVGFLTGIIPCPTALAIILAAVSAHQLFIGVKLVIAFSIGGALTMATLGYLVSRVSETINKKEYTAVIKITTFLSSLLIMLLGLFIFMISVKNVMTF